MALTQTAAALVNAGLDSTVLKSVTVTLTNSELKAIRATPKELVAAPGAGKALVYLGSILENLGGTNAITETTDNMAVRYENTTGVIASQTIEATGFVDQTAKTITQALPKIDPIIASATVANKALVLHNTGDGEYAGNAANDVTIKVTTWYRVFTLS